MRTREKPIDPRFRLLPGQSWHQGARVTRPKRAPAKSKRRRK